MGVNVYFIVDEVVSQYLVIACQLCDAVEIHVYIIIYLPGPT